MYSFQNGKSLNWAKKKKSVPKFPADKKGQA